MPLYIEVSSLMASNLQHPPFLRLPMHFAQASQANLVDLMILHRSQLKAMQ